MNNKLLERFIRYVQIDTTSDAQSPATPSTDHQWDLARLLVQELQDLGVAEVTLTDHCFVIGRIPPSPDVAANLPTVALFSHLDTAADAPGCNINPQIHACYDGNPITLRRDPLVVLDPHLDADLAAEKGHTIITTDGRTLLGADDKAGIAVIMTVVDRLLRDSSLKHGPLRIVFNPDEEIARGVEKLSLEALGADVAYTLDTGNPATVSFETFSADKAEITITGRSEHPGTARGRMINAIMLGSKLLALLPRENLAPESTNGRLGFIHPLSFVGNAERACLTFILRDFELEKLAALRTLVRTLCQAVEATAPGSSVQCLVSPQYRNMRDTLLKDMRPVEYARDAVRRLGLTPIDSPMRGGTDGSVLTARGLPTPNLGRGGRNAHSVREWVSLREMETSVEVVLGVLQRWTESRA